MSKKVLNTFIIIFCVVICIFTIGCTPSEVVHYELPEEKITSAFSSWQPVAFTEHALYEYDIVFESTDVELYETGTLSLQVGGNAPAAISLKYSASLFDSSISGRVRGNKAAIFSKMKNKLNEESIFSSIYSVLFEPMENEDMFSAMVADYTKLKLGESWTYEHADQVYKITVTDINDYGGIDGVEFVITLDGEFLFSMCLSPMCPLPIMTLFTYESDGVTTYIMCALSKMYK